MVQCERVVTPEAVLPLSEDQMRGVGLSYAKVSPRLLHSPHTNDVGVYRSMTAERGQHSSLAVHCMKCTG